MSQAYAVEERPGTGEVERMIVERAAGLLAERTNCPVGDAHRHLHWIAADRGRDLLDVAAGMIRLLDKPSPFVATVQRILDVNPGICGFFTIDRDCLVWAAASPDACGPDGRHGTTLLGERLDPGAHAATYRAVLETGEPAVIGPFRAADGRWTIRAQRLGPGLLLHWVRHDDAARRLADVERRLADEHALAARLQRIVLPLPEGPIEMPGLKVAVRYLPAGQESLVGGDWYQAVPLRDGSVLLAVGDVAGHGIQAATTMAQMRYALRALAVTTSDPGVLLAHLNKLTCDLGSETPELSATAVVARYDPGRHEIVWAQAGHPPPLLSRDGRTAPLSRPPGPMLGVIDDAVYPTARVAFHPRDVLLLYTDGLVEHRRRGLDDGLAQVIAAVDDAVRASPRQPLAQLLARLRQANPDDDTCILAARAVTGDTADLSHHFRMTGHR